MNSNNYLLALRCPMQCAQTDPLLLSRARKNVPQNLACNEYEPSNGKDQLQ